MLPRQERLRTREDFAHLRQKGIRYRQKHLSLVVLREESLRRLTGFIVSKRVSKKATERNRVKRRLRAIVAQYVRQVDSGCLLLFIARPAANHADFQDLRHEVLLLLQKAGVIRE